MSALRDAYVLILTSAHVAGLFVRGPKPVQPVQASRSISCMQRDMRHR